MSDEQRKYDSQVTLTVHNARLTKDPQIIEGGDKPMVKLTFALESRSDRHSTLWVECTVNDRQADMASALKAKDVLGFQGFPALRRWGDNNEKFSFECVRTELYPSIDLLMKLKERGWVPGQKGAAKKPAAKPTKQPPARAAKGRQVQSLDEDLADD